MSNYLEQVLNATKAHNQGVRRTRSAIDTMVSMLQPQAAPTGGTAPVGKNPHSMGDGHGHTSAAEVKGLNAEFNSRLQRLLKDSGGRVTVGSGYRSMAEQAVLYERYKRGDPRQKAPAAAPGKSNHNHGLAADLKYANEDAKRWVHQNASKYGLFFPMSYEPWHIEPVGVKQMRK